jgi:hypothetical protein
MKVICNKWERTYGQFTSGKVYTYAEKDGVRPLIIDDNGEYISFLNFPKEEFRPLREINLKNILG